MLSPMDLGFYAFSEPFLPSVIMIYCVPVSLTELRVAEGRMHLLPFSSLASSSLDDTYRGQQCFAERRAAALTEKKIVFFPPEITN